MATVIIRNTLQRQRALMVEWANLNGHTVEGESALSDEILVKQPSGGWKTNSAMFFECIAWVKAQIKKQIDDELN